MFQFGHRGRHGHRFAHGMREEEDRSAMFDRRGGGFGRGGFGRDGFGRGGMGRFFEHGDIRLVVLGLIEEKPRHGYEIIKAIEDRLHGTYSPSPGVVYPTLSLLEEQGLVTATPDGAKKLHTLTEEGRAFLAANRGTVDALFARMSAVGGDGRDSGPAPAVVRAMHNLKLALRLRMGRGGITPDAAAAIAAALDAAATAIERT